MYVGGLGYSIVEGVCDIIGRNSVTLNSALLEIMVELGKALLGLGLLLAVVGALLLLAARFGLPLGRLPGDFSYRGRNVSFFFPLATSILLSVVLSLIFYLISRFRR